MDMEALRALLLSKTGAVEEMPFGPEALVYKVVGKMFALLAWQSDPLHLTLKCDPAYAEMLRQRYEAVQPGYYMNKRHWNTIALDGSIPEAGIRSMVDESYELVVQGLKKADRETLQALD